MILEVICLVVLLLINIGFLFKVGIKLSNIGVLFVFYWVINILLSFLLFTSFYSWHVSGLVFLIVCVDVFALSFFILSGKKISEIPRYSSLKEKHKFIKFILLFCLAAGISYVFFELNSNGFDLSIFFSIESIMESGNYFTDGRYGDTELSVPLIGQICLSFNYSAFVFAGYLYKLKCIKNWYCFLQFIPMTMSTLATTAKTGLISGILLWICGYLVASNYPKIKNRQIPSNTISVKKILMVAIVLLTIFFLSFVIRYDSSNSMAIFNRIFIYAFGHVPCYDDWFSKFDANLFGYSYGQQSIQMIFGSKMPESLQYKYVVPSLETPFGWTNVNTMFAYVLMDFGYVGSLLFYSILGIIAAVSTNCLKGGYNSIPHTLLGIIFYCVLYSFLICPLKYTTIFLAFVLFGFYLHFLLKNSFFKFTK